MIEYTDEDIREVNDKIQEIKDLVFLAKRGEIRESDALDRILTCSVNISMCLSRADLVPERPVSGVTGQ